MQWFNSTDPTCPFANFTLVAQVEDSESFIPLVNDNIALDLENETILVKTDTSLALTFFLNASTVGNVWKSQEISVFICGQEKVSFKGQAVMDLSYEDDSDLSITADTFLEGFVSSDPLRCPVTMFSLASEAGAKIEKPVLVLDGSAITLASEVNPEITFDFTKMFKDFEKLTTFFVQGCTFAKQCSEYTVNLKKITCDESILSADAADLGKEITIESSVTIGKSDYEELFKSTNPKCPVVKWGLAWKSGDEMQSDLDGIIAISEGGEVTFDNEGLIALETPSVTFEIVGEAEYEKRASVSVPLTIIPPEPEVPEENATEAEAVVESNETAVVETKTDNTNDQSSSASASIIEEEPLPVTEPAPDPPPAPGKNPVKKVPGVFNFSPLWVAKPKPVVVV